MNKLDKIIFINNVFAISNTKRIMYGQGEELTLDEWNAANKNVDAFPELSNCLGLEQAAVLYAGMTLTKQEADDFNAYGQLLERHCDDDDVTQLIIEADNFWKEHEDSFDAYRAVCGAWDREDYLGAKEGDSYWDRIEYFF